MPCEITDFGSNLECEIVDMPDGFSCGDMTVDNLNQVLAMLRKSTVSLTESTATSISGLKETIEQNNCMSITANTSGADEFPLSAFVDTDGCLKFTADCQEAVLWSGSQPFPAFGSSTDVTLAVSAETYGCFEFVWDTGEGGSANSQTVTYADLITGPVDLVRAGFAGQDDVSVELINNFELRLTKPAIQDFNDNNSLTSMTGLCTC